MQRCAAHRRRVTRRTDHNPASSNAAPMRNALRLDTAGAGLRVTQIGEGVAGWQNPLAQSALKSQFWPSAAKHVPKGLQARVVELHGGRGSGGLQQGSSSNPQPSEARPRPAASTSTTTTAASLIRIMVARVP